MPDEDSLRHKYEQLPEDAPRHRKKSKKRHVRSDHKHEYEDVCIDAGSYSITHNGRVSTYHLAVRCKVCGRVRDVWYWHFKDDPPKDLPLYRVNDFWELLKMKVLPDEMRVR